MSNKSVFVILLIKVRKGVSYIINEITIRNFMIDVLDYYKMRDDEVKTLGKKL